MSYELLLSGALPRSITPRLKFHGEPVTVERDNAQRWRAHFSAMTPARRLSPNLDALQISLPTPCGLLEGPFRPASHNDVAYFQRRLRSEEDFVAPRKMPAELHYFLADLKLPPAMLITVDRRGKLDATVALGAFSLRGAGLKPPAEPVRPWTRPKGLAPGDAALFHIFAPTCAEGRKVRVDGKVVSALPATRHARRTTALIDVAGGHCYARHLTLYPSGSKTSAALHGERVYMIDQGPPVSAAEGPFPACPGLLPKRPRCVDLRLVRCAGGK